MRVLLSTITWSNRGTAILDTDNFNATYGANAAVARLIVDRAMDDWERVIANFNGFAGRNTYALNVNAAAISGRGSTGSYSYDLLLKPQAATITMDDNGGGTGWYFDPTIGSANVPDDGEFVNPVTPFMATFTAAGGANDDNDFYRTIVHEIGHAMGLSSSSVLITNNETDAGDDPNDGGSARLSTIQTGGVTYTLTSSGGRHLFEGGGGYGGPVHPNDLMNAGRTVGAPPTTRQLIGDTITTFLRDLYGYTVTMPSLINTFYANLNTTTNVLTINGDINPNGSDNDVIDLEVDGTSMSFEVNGTDEVIAGAQFSSIVVNAGGGNDDVDVDHLLSGKSLTINLGAGNDRADVSQEDGDIDSNVLSNFTVNGGSGTDTIAFHDTADGSGSDTWTISSSSVAKSTRVMTYNDVELLDVNGSAQNTTYHIDSTPSITALDIVAGAGNDTFNVGDGDFDSNLGGSATISAGGGTDQMIVNDTADGPTGDVYDFFFNQFSKPGQIVNHSGLEAISLLGNDQNSTYRINSTNATLTIACGDGDDTIRIGDATGSVTSGGEDITALISVNGGGGADLFFVGNGDLDEVSAPIIVNGGGVSGGLDNHLFVNDADDLGADQYDLVDGLLTKTAGGGVFVSLNYSFINETLIDLNGVGNVFNFTNGFGFPTLQGNAGDDTFNVISTSTAATVPTVRGGAGLDDVIVNEDEVGTATAVFDQDEDLNNLYLFEGSTVTVAANGNTGIVANSIGNLRGILNVNDNFVIDRSPNNVSFLVDKLTRGYNSGAWNGTPGGGAAGVIRSAVAAGAGGGDAVGYAVVGAGAGELNIASYRGATVGAGDFIASYTLYGDTDLNRTVNLADFNRLAANFGATNRSWVQGNSNYDNVVNLTDFNLLAANFGLSAASEAGLAAGTSTMSERELRRLLEDVTGSASGARSATSSAARTDRVLSGLEDDLVSESGQ